MIILKDNKQFGEIDYKLEEDIERDVLANSKLIFGPESIFIDSKKRIDGKAIGGAIPDGFLFDLSDKNNPEFYLVEAELANHDFFKHIFPQITKFFAFFKNKKSQSELIKKIYSEVDNNAELKKQFKKYLGEKEIFKFVNDTIENSQNILIVIDGEKSELPEIIDTYSDTWGKMVKVMIFKKFANQNEAIFTIEPEFKDIEYSTISSIDQEQIEVEINEEFHLDGVKNNVKEIYSTVKTRLLDYDETLIFNPKKYYISIIKNRNISFITIRKSLVRVVVMMPFEQVKEKVKNIQVSELSDSVQRFWNGPSCELKLESTQHIDELLNIIKEIIDSED